jgi:hypothetical protein
MKHLARLSALIGHENNFTLSDGDARIVVYHEGRRLQVSTCARLSDGSLALLTSPAPRD